jgi:hypothetical protein
MTRISMIVTGVLFAIAGTARAQPAPPPDPPLPPDYAEDGTYDGDDYGSQEYGAYDDTLAPADQPTEAPPAIPQQVQGAPGSQIVVQAQPPPAGQWIYTRQYGWVWMPYGDQYVRAGADSTAYSYVYYPSSGWVWLSTPWVYGTGPRPYFGHRGYAHYRWYPRTWGSAHAYRGGRVRVYGGGGYRDHRWGGGGYHGGRGYGGGGYHGGRGGGHWHR